MNTTISQYRILRGVYLERERKQRMKDMVQTLGIWVACFIGVLAMWWPK